MTTTHPTGRMLKRALGEPAEKNGVIFASWPWTKPVIWQSLNTHGVQFRVRQLQWDCIRLRKGLGELYTPQEQNDHLAKPVTKKDILTGYLKAGHYNNNFKPRV